MIDVFQATTNPISGERFQCILSDENVYVMDWLVQPKGYVPFEHIHLNQDESFEIKEGEIKLVIEGKELIGKKGDVITVPKGGKHIAYNNTDSILHCVVSYSPALDYMRFCQCFNGLTNDKYLDEKGGVNIPMMGYMLEKMKCKAMARPTKIPAPVFGISLKAFYLIGSLKGWDKLYTKYTK